MRFMMFMIPNEQAEAGIMPGPEVFEAMMRFNHELSQAGVLLELNGLHPTSKGARVRFSGGKATVLDGPFTETKEIIGGYWMIEVDSKEDAIDWAKRCPARDGEVIQIRQVHELSDFPESVQNLEHGIASKS